jgi:chorismate mutase
MDITECRNKIDQLDILLVDLLNQRTKVVQEIGRLKRGIQKPINEPEREKLVLQNVSRANHGPLPDSELRSIYEHIIAVMRKVQKDSIAVSAEPSDRFL